ncbi:hypothetical protein ACIQU4_09605 [Streptomyces sp. NPDC090741]|uniref:hypothetical protein n=1 Tax=Streptomyces sp. NPDC090741 TaxID=3365967 RepID=UPI0037FF6496
MTRVEERLGEEVRLVDNRACRLCPVVRRSLKAGRERWQCGEARVPLPDRTVHIMPYQVAVNVTFDQTIQDIASLPDG